MSVKDDLIAAKALIDTPEKWGKGRGEVPPANGRCILDACGKIGGAWRFAPRLEAALPPGHGWRSLLDFNDDPSVTHADIMALFDRAIEDAS